MIAKKGGCTPPAPPPESVSVTSFFSIIMRIHITSNKYTVNKILKMKNNPKYTNIHKTKSIQKNYLDYFIRKLRLGERK